MIIRNNIHDSTIKTRKYSIEEIKSRTVGEPFELISTEYVNAHEKLLWKCYKCGENWAANWHNISFGKGCRNCRRLKCLEVGNKKKPTLIEINNLLINKKILLLENCYINAHTKMSLFCLVCGIFWKNDYHHLKGQDAGCPSCAIRRKEKHHNWRGGCYGKYSKEWTNELKEKIRNRDNRKCQYPDCVYDDTKERVKLHVHHINGDKQNCKEWNLISLCNKHHMKIESNIEKIKFDEYFYTITKDYA